ncbi:MAG TPA: tetratricopeptide repeat protein [Schlesneria sp.]|jgi:tetratricopeptide (TPR) repeat protein
MPTETTETQDVPDGQDVPSTGLRGFSMLFVVIAVFPIALGIGFTLQTATPPPGKLDAAEQPAPPVPNQIQQHLPLKPGPDRSKGDDLLREGRHEAALHLYRSLGSADSLRVAADLSIRMGFCQEGLGQWDEALATYRFVADSHHPVLAVCATLSQARIWIRLNDFDAAEPLLRSLLLRSGDGLPAGMKEEVALLYSIVAAEQTLPANSPLTAGLSPVSNLIEWSQAEILKWADATPDQPATADEINLRVSAPTKPVAEADLADNQVAAATLLGEPFRITARQQSINQIVTRLADECGFQLEWSDEALEQRASSRVLDVAVRDLPLSLVLSLLSQEVRATWTLQMHTRTLLITTTNGEADALQIHRSATMSLASAVAMWPEHRLTAPANFARAQLAAADSRLVDAAETYSALIGKSVSPLGIRAAFNAALAYHRAGDLVGTCRMLEVIVHGAPGSDLHTRSMILYGRALMDRGEFREAAFQLKRAASSRQTPDDQARAAVFLAMALLLDGRPLDAGEALFAHRLQFQDRSVRNAAALMTSLARWRTATTAGKARETAFLYRSIVAVDGDAEWLGPTGQLLLGQAMHEADLDDRMLELYSSVLEHGACELVEMQMKLALADYRRTHDQIPDAKVIWLEIYAMDRPESVTAGMRLAQLALDEQDLALCLELCHAIQERDHVPKTELLKLAGRAYDLGGYPILAAHCYAGKWPLP